VTSETENTSAPEDAVPPSLPSAGDAPAFSVAPTPQAPPEGDDERAATWEAAQEAVEEDIPEPEDSIPEPEDTRPVKPLMDISGEEEQVDFRWYILKVQVNREDSIRDTLQRRVKIAGLERFFGEIVVPTEDIREYTKSGKARVVKRKLYPGYIVVNMAVNDDSWFLVRDTPGIGDFTGSAGKPAPLPQHEVDKLLRTGKPADEGKGQVRTAIPFKHGDRVRVKDGHFQNFEGEVDTIDEANGRVTVMINIFGRSTPVELEHWQIENI
jgi:transcriptional antiterminator NusG